MRYLKFAILGLALFIVTGANAQSPLPKGQTQLNAGFGLSSWGIPLYIGLEHGVHPDISVGGELSFRNYRENWKGNKYRHGIIGIAATGNYHFNTILNIPSNWDFYAGLNLGFYIWNSASEYPGGGTSGLGIGAQIGGRYYITESFGLNLELGTGNAFSDGKFGVSFRL